MIGKKEINQREGVKCPLLIFFFFKAFIILGFYTDVRTGHFLMILVEGQIELLEYPYSK